TQVQVPLLQVPGSADHGLGARITFLDAALLVATDAFEFDAQGLEFHRVLGDAGDLGLVVVVAGSEVERPALQRDRVAADDVDAARARVDGIGEVARTGDIGD